jgi:[ribosomal protein S5]-alanine N-acetyltransferase
MNAPVPQDIPGLTIRLPQPVVRSARLTLRPLTEADAETVQRLCSDREIAATTMHIPHPYPAGAAMEFIRSRADAYASAQAASWGMEMRGSGIVGVIGLSLVPAHRNVELGYWVGRPFWGQGIATEAAIAMVRCAFERFDAVRVHAHHFSRNPASGRVLQRAGMRHEGTLRSHVLKWGVFEDLELYGILRSEVPEALAP